MTESGRQGTCLPKDKEKSGSIRKFLKMVALMIEKVLNDRHYISWIFPPKTTNMHGQQS